MLDIKARRIDILGATDIVARGIDIDDITLVINYDVPHDAEDYVHRIGRTARAGRDGRAVTFVNEKDRQALASIEHLLEKEVPRAELPEGFEAPDFSKSRKKPAARSGKPAQKRGGKGCNAHKPRSKKPAGSDKKASPSSAENSTESAEKTHKSAHRRRGNRHHSSKKSAAGNDSASPEKHGMPPATPASE